MNIIVAISGASGSIFGIKLLKALAPLKGIKTHLIISDWAKKNIEIETSESLQDIIKLADHIYDNKDLGASLASGSFLHQGMVISPCSMKTLSSIAHGYSDNLISRAADVCLKEHRPLLLVPRESPLSSIHLENLLKLSNLGVRIIPPIPEFYTQPHSIDDLLDSHITRILDQLQLKYPKERRWKPQ